MAIRFLQELGEPVKYSGRLFSQQELQLIRGLIAEEPPPHRTALSRLICEQLGWRKPDGGLKEMSCRVALLRMERDGLLQLPPSRPIFATNRPVRRRTSQAEPQLPLLLDSAVFSALEVHRVSAGKEAALWREYIDRYHYLGYQPSGGAQMRYWVRWGGEPVALLGFAAAAWKTAPRDQFIGWSPKQREQRLHLLVNNTRFLLLPWVQGRNLASKILALLIKRLPQDWLERYGYRPVLLETFVDSQLFRGTCYQAANWIKVGLTQGRGKWNVRTTQRIPKKTIWLYPLTKEFRSILCS